MEDIAMNTQYLLDLKARVREMGSACQVLNNFFATGAVRIAQEPDVERLRSLATQLKHKLEEAGLSEERARSSLAEWDGGIKMGNSIVAATGSAIGKRGWVEGAERLEKRRASKQHDFGMILVCVGQGGLPDDVHVVSISELARIKNRAESEIIREIQQAGELLFSPEVFLQMLDTIIEQLRRGELRLPIPPKQLPAKLAVAREITVEFRLPFKAVPQLAPGRNMNTGGSMTKPH
jgi:hypothetical protein